MLIEKPRIQENTNNQKKLWKVVIFPHSMSNNSLSPRVYFPFLYIILSLYVSLCIYLADICPTEAGVALLFCFSLSLLVQAGTSCLWGWYICVAQMYVTILILYESNMAVLISHTILGKRYRENSIYIIKITFWHIQGSLCNPIFIGTSLISWLTHFCSSSNNVCFFLVQIYYRFSG